MITDSYILVEPDIKKALKIMAAQKGIAMKVLARKYILEGLRKEKEEGNNEN